MAGRTGLIQNGCNSGRRPHKTDRKNTCSITLPLLVNSGEHAPRHSMNDMQRGTDDDLVRLTCGLCE
jgi:hypothetical protein